MRPQTIWFSSELKNKNLWSIVVENVINLELRCDLKNATIVWSRYSLYSIPIFDKTVRILGDIWKSKTENECLKNL